MKFGTWKCGQNNHEGDGVTGGQKWQAGATYPAVSARRLNLWRLVGIVGLMETAAAAAQLHVLCCAIQQWSDMMQHLLTQCV